MERLRVADTCSTSSRASESARQDTSQRQASHPALQLQRTLGNRAVQRLLRHELTASQSSRPSPADLKARTGRHSIVTGGGPHIARNVFDAIKKFFNPPPQLQANPSRPQPGNCGELRWTTSWTLSKYGRGGFVIQKVNWKETLQRSFDHPWGEVNTQTYYEAWWVVANGKSPSNDDAVPDTFGRKIPHDAARGTVEIDATAQYHDDVEESQLPADMKRFNPATNAGALRSSLNDPNLGGNISAPIPHYLKYEWDCFDAIGNWTNRPTRVLKRIP